MIKHFQNNMSPSRELLIGLLDGTAWRINRYSQIQVNAIFRDHEEADSRRFVYASYLCTFYPHLTRLVIHYPYTDVAVICCYHYSHTLKGFEEIWFHTGSGNNRRFIPIHTICDKLGATKVFLDGVYVNVFPYGLKIILNHTVTCHA